MQRSLPRATRLGSALATLALCLVPALASAQRPASRLSGNLASQPRAALPGSAQPLARTADDIGALDPATPLPGMTLVFAPSAAQQAALQQLLAAQQSKTSPLYHAWLTPAQFGATFGMSDADLARAQSWLQSQGFTVLSVAPSRNRITFSGTAAQAEAAFGTPLHNFRSADGKIHFAPTGELSLPASLTSVTSTVTNLSSFRPRSRAVVRTGGVRAPAPRFTSSQSGNHYLTPGDVRTIYNITPAYNAGFTGAGQSIAVVGQSAVVLSDIEAFQTAAGLTVKDPTLVLVPNSGTSTVYSADESESDLDLEYSGAIAPGATIKFVYVGSSTSFSVNDAIAYAVTNNLAPILSTSYGECEPELSATDYTSQNAVLEQAAAQGQSIIAPGGDSGSTDCAGISGLAATTQGQLAVDFPASSQYVTALGGSEFSAANIATTNTTYWQASTGTDVISSALSYIPEQVWNDSTTTADSAGGGGTSTYTPRPSWQTGVTGIASGSFRLVPDLALAASPANPGYLYCSSDNSETGVTGSCANGFRDSSDTYLTVAGGTSFAAPIFAGMLALINQSQGATAGQGLINPTLYALAGNSTTYASSFHDITTGNNACLAAYVDCSTAGAASYAATIGYDQATGLGSVNLFNLLSAWSSASTTTSSLLGTTTTLAPATTTPAAGASDLVTVTVAPAAASTSTPTGTVALSVDGTATTLTLSAGAATYTFSSSTAGSHTLTATYSGDTTFAASTTTLTLTVPSTNTSSSSFSLAATNLTVAAGSSATSTVTITPSGYTGTVAWTVARTSSLTNACYSIASTTVSGTAPVTTELTVYTSTSACTTLTPLSVRSGRHAFALAGPASARDATPTRNSGTRHPAEIALGALLGLGLLTTRSRRLRPLLALLVIAGAGLTLSGCSGGATTLSGTTANPGTYTFTLTGTDTASSSYTASTTFTVTVQ